MDLQGLNATIEQDPLYGDMLVLDSEDWEKTYEQYKIIESNYEKEECDEIKNRATKLIQSWCGSSQKVFYK